MSYIRISATNACIFKHSLFKPLYTQVYARNPGGRHDATKMHFISAGSGLRSVCRCKHSDFDASLGSQFYHFD